MIIEMARVRVLGPRPRLDDVLGFLQDFGLLHLASATRSASLAPVRLSARGARERRYLRRALEDLAAVAGVLGLEANTARLRRETAAATRADFARWVRLARRVRRRLERLADREAELREEQGLLHRYRGFFRAFQPLLERVGQSPRLTAHGLVLRGDERAAIERLEEELGRRFGEEFALETHGLESGDIALLVILPKAGAGRLEELLAESQVPEIPVPAQYGGGALAEAVPAMLERLEEIPDELDAIAAERRSLAESQATELARARRAIHDRLAELEARTLSSESAHLFVVEGWLPASETDRLAERVADEFGPTVVLEEMTKEEWVGEEAPVVLSNPRIFRPFETLIRLMPLPAYGSIDPTPFVAVFFPMFFGLMLGDVGYGLMLAGLGVFLHWRSRPDTVLRAVAEIIGPCALFTIIFGVLYGEFFGDLGRRLFGLYPLAFDREEGILAALVLAVGLGVVHILLGLGLGVIEALRGDPRQALGRGVAALMVVLIVTGLLAAVEILPSGFFTPAVVALLVLFPILVIAEGLVAPVEFLSTLGNILSYARIMAVGTASVMLAVVANRMAGAMGSALVGIVFALLFHLVNFAVGIFSPTIHALRLHYVEFFGKFYSPGGRRYEPFRHWRPERDESADGLDRQERGKGVS